MTTAGEMLSRVKWYQVVLSVSDRPGGEVRGRVQARTPDLALRALMRAHGVSSARRASVWLLGRSGAPSTRVNVRCRLPVGNAVVRSS